MPRMSKLSKQTRETFRALEELQQQFPEGVPPMILAERIAPREMGLLREAERVRARLRPGQALPPATIRAVARLFENFDRPRARVLDNILRRFHTWTPRDAALHTENVDNLLQELREMLRGLVQNRVGKLRTRLEKTTRGEPHVMSVSRAPYRIEATGTSLVEEDLRQVRLLRTMVDRPAWRNPIGPVERQAFIRAQDRFRFAIAQGIGTDDTGAVQFNAGTPRALLQCVDLRRKLERAYETSRAIEEIFDLAYAAHPEASDPERSLVLRAWAAAHFEDLARFLNGARNAILRLLNPYFRRAGLERIPLVVASRRADVARRVPSEADPAPVEIDDATLMHLYERLHAAGEAHRFEPPNDSVGAHTASQEEVA